MANPSFEFDFEGMGGTTFSYYCTLHCLSGMKGSVTVQAVAGVSGQGSPGAFAGLSGLHASPNPFNPDTVVRFILAQADHVQLRVFDATGRQIVLLADEPMQPGSYNIPWDGRTSQGRQAPSGIYYISGKTSKGRSIAPMALIR
ncbi:MAG: FlgD immunoglobulin-like domain containing protein [Pseudomonadota bacterium]